MWWRWAGSAVVESCFAIWVACSSDWTSSVNCSASAIALAFSLYKAYVCGVSLSRESLYLVSRFCSFRETGE